VAEKILKELSSDYIAGLSLLGGEPLEPQNQAALLPFVRAVKTRFPQKSIWCYTGFTFDEKKGVLREINKNTPYTEELISLFDVLVDGAFIEELKDIRLKFRGSSNQRVIDVQKSLAQKECIKYLE
jgi:anaerobic ribonucleoside-triphosphate reductase activating protein